MEISSEILARIHAHGEACYPEEGNGFLMGTDTPNRRVTAILPLTNSREDTARNNRYLISAQDYLKGEMEAERLGLTLLGVYHSHPDHPNRPSEFDREWAQPFFSYLITSIQSGRVVASASWRLSEDRSGFLEDRLIIIPKDK